MFKRVMWLGVGAAAGSATTVWAQRRVKDKVALLSERATTAHAIEVARGAAGNVAQTVRSAVAEGRATMEEAEREMRSTAPYGSAGQESGSTRSR